MIYMRFPEGKPKALTFSYDDGVKQDVRLVDIFNKNDLKATFNINSGGLAVTECVGEKGDSNKLSYDQVLELYKNHEVAIHTLNHPYLDEISPAAATYQVIEDRKNLERMFKKPIRGMAYPMGTFNDNVVQILKNCGIAYSRTVISTENFDIPTDWLRLNATCHHNNPNLMNLANKFICETPNRFPWLFYVWGHSYEFDTFDNWNVIENFCTEISRKDDVWYATNIEIYDYTEAYRSLIIGVEENMFCNPSLIDIWFVKNGDLYCVRSGEIIFTE